MCNGAHLPWGMSLVIMETSLHTDQPVARDVIENEYKVSLVTFHCKEGGRRGRGRERERERERERVNAMRNEYRH